MELSDKEKKFDSMSSTSSHQHDKSITSSPTNEAQSLPTAPPVHSNDFSSPFVPNSLPVNPHSVTSYDTPRTTPKNLISSFNSHSNINSPYSVHAPVASPYYTQSPSPYSTTTAYQQSYHHTPAPYNIPAEQSYSNSPSLYRDPSLVYQPSQRNYHSGQTYPYN